MEYIKDYDFSIRYFPDKGNVVVDALSRKLATLVAMSAGWKLMEQFKNLNLDVY